jgi:hypothetical protein
MKPKLNFDSVLNSLNECRETSRISLLLKLSSTTTKNRHGPLRISLWIYPYALFVTQNGNALALSLLLFWLALVLHWASFFPR